MNFLAPVAFFFAASIPVVIVFYLLKRKRQVKLVSSTLLWQKFLAETQANAPFQKLRNNWLMLFQLLLLALAVFALARPFFLGKAKSSELRVVILDGSASMQATDVSPSRFEVARAEALKLVSALTQGPIAVSDGPDDRHFLVPITGRVGVDLGNCCLTGTGCKQQYRTENERCGPDFLN